MNVFKQFVIFYDGWGKQFQVAVSLNNDVMTSFDSRSDPEPQNLSLILWTKLFEAATKKDVNGQHINLLKYFLYV
jgi:hypothetical protein